MPETEELVINTGPLLALIAGIGDLSLLELKTGSDPNKSLFLQKILP
jgi:hypothetical protein